MKKLKNIQGITLVALVVTIIVLIILAGVSISLVLGNNGIITKAREARDKWSNAIEQEEQELELLENEMNSHVGKQNTNKDKVKSIDVGLAGNALILKNSGELCKFSYNGTNGEYVNYDNTQEKTIASGVKEFNGNGYYLTTTNDLCYYNEEEETTKTIASGVKEFNSSGEYFLTITNDLCYYNGTTAKTIASEVKEFDYNGYYLTVTNDLGYYNGSEETSKAIASGVKEFHSTYGSCYYLTTTNDLCCYNKREETSKTIGSGVKDFDGYGYFLTTTNDLCYYNGTTSRTIGSGVKEFEGPHYLTTTNNLCYYDTIIANNVIRWGSYGNWYETASGDIYVELITAM